MASWKVKCIGCSKVVPLTCVNCGNAGLTLRDNTKGEYFECSHCKEEFDTVLHECIVQTSDETGYHVYKEAHTYLKRNRDNFFEWGKGWGIDGLFGLICFFVISGGLETAMAGGY